MLIPIPITRYMLKNTENVAPLQNVKELTLQILHCLMECANELHFVKKLQ